MPQQETRLFWSNLWPLVWNWNKTICQVNLIILYWDSTSYHLRLHRYESKVLLLDYHGTHILIVNKRAGFLQKRNPVVRVIPAYNKAYQTIHHHWKKQYSFHLLHISYLYDLFVGSTLQLFYIDAWEMIVCDRPQTMFPKLSTKCRLHLMLNPLIYH